jgi:CBS domain-containing membrane protein
MEGPMREEANLELDLDGEGSGRVARVSLKEELDAVLEAAQTEFGGEQDAKAASTAPAEVSAEQARKPILDVTLKVGEVMTREVKTVDRNDRISIAGELMKAGRFRHVVALDDNGRVAGVVSHRDIVYGALAWTLGQGREAHDKALESYPVKDVMATVVTTIDSDAPLRDAAALMRERKLGCLPVVDGEELVGILTEGDFLYLLAG